MFPFQSNIATYIRTYQNFSIFFVVVGGYMWDLAGIPLMFLQSSVRTRAILQDRNFTQFHYGDYLSNLFLIIT